MARKVLTLISILHFTATFAQSASTYKRFGGTITVITGEAIKYDDEILLIYHTDPKLLSVFELGLLYPSLFKDAAIQTTVAAGEVKHEVTISDFRIFQSESPKIKTFQFKVLYNDTRNPRNYWLQLVNDNANWKMDILTFVRDARIQSMKIL